MERYIGMDVHAASCTLAVISEKGRRLKDFQVETNGQALVEAIRMIPGHKQLVMEEGLQSAWLYETLSPHVDELVVAGINVPSRGAAVSAGRRSRFMEPELDLARFDLELRPMTLARVEVVPVTGAQDLLPCVGVEPEFARSNDADVLGRVAMWRDGLPARVAGEQDIAALGVELSRLEGAV